MSEHVYDDVNFSESRRQVDMAVNIFANAEAVRCHSTNTEMEYGNIAQNLKVQHTGGDTAGGRCYRVTAVCLLLLCVLLLTAVTVLWIKFNNLNTENNQIQTSYNNLTIKRDQLQTSNNNLRDQLQREREELQRFSKLVFGPGWIYFSSSLYYISTEKKNWTESRKDCREKGADLVIINSTEEQEFIQKHKRGAWIGLSDGFIEGDWKWVDNTSVTTGFWWHGEPNSNGEEDCAMMGYGTDPVLTWADYPCETQFVWICEKII